MGLLDKISELEAAEDSGVEPTTQAETPQEQKPEVVAEAPAADEKEVVAEAPATDEKEVAPAEPKKSGGVKKTKKPKTINGIKSKTGPKTVSGSKKTVKGGSAKTTKGGKNKFENMANTARAARTGKTSADVRQTMAAMDKLNEVGEDGLTHKERMEKQVAEQAGKIKKIIFGCCGLLLLVIVGLVIMSQCSSSSRGYSQSTVSSGRPDKVNYSHSPKALEEAARVFNSRATAFCKKNLKAKGKAFCREGVTKMVKAHLAKYPKNKKLTDKYVKLLEEDGWI